MPRSADSRESRWMIVQLEVVVVCRNVAGRAHWSQRPLRPSEGKGPPAWPRLDHRFLFNRTTSSTNPWFSGRKHSEPRSAGAPQGIDDHHLALRHPLLRQNDFCRAGLFLGIGIRAPGRFQDGMRARAVQERRRWMMRIKKSSSRPADLRTNFVPVWDVKSNEKKKKTEKKTEQGFAFRP